MENINDDFFKFVHDNLTADPVRLRLKHGSKQDPFSYDLAITQIECRRRFGHKLPLFLANDRCIFPDKISGEQSSNEGVAFFHASLPEKGDRILDMTGGLGIDTFAFSKIASQIITIERDYNKFQALKHNLTVSNIKNVEILNCDSIEFIQLTPDNFDLVFIDPARRDLSGKRVYSLYDCEPDIISHQETVLSKCKRLLIKASPLLDITQTIKDFPGITSIRVVGVKGECKEILIEIDRSKNTSTTFPESKNTEPTLEAIELNLSGNIIYRFVAETSSSYKTDVPITFADSSDLKQGNYLYEPSAMMMKLGAWVSLCQKFTGIKKFGQSSHLFVSKDLYEDFPGRISRIENMVTKQDRKAMKDLPVNIVSKNYPLSADELKKFLNTKEGDNKFLYASRIDRKPVMLLTEKVKI